MFVNPWWVALGIPAPDAGECLQSRSYSAHQFQFLLDDGQLAFIQRAGFMPRPCSKVDCLMKRNFIEKVRLFLTSNKDKLFLGILFLWILLLAIGTLAAVYDVESILHWILWRAPGSGL
jgi:hypothetical protein